MPLPTPENRLTIAQFEEKLMDGDRWVELIEGRFVRLSPPDDAHGDVVRNLSRALAAYMKRSDDTYACFELPLIIKREPPTVRSPAVCCFRFQGEGRFAETDKLMTDSCPILVIEVASTSERREAMSDRVQAYLAWGVAAVWVIDPVTLHVHQFRGRNSSDMLKEPQVLLGHAELPGFAMPIGDLFRQPEWAKAKLPVISDVPESGDPSLN